MCVVSSKTGVAVHFTAATHVAVGSKVKTKCGMLITVGHVFAQGTDTVTCVRCARMSKEERKKMRRFA